jgi:hypothetical protein
MKKPRRKAYRGRRQRIYYGRDKVTGEPLYDSVYVTDAKQAVRMPGNMMHALMGQAKQSVACHLSNCGWENKDLFPHVVVGYPSFSRAACLVPDEIRDGRLYHAVRYEHDYADLVDKNDFDEAKNYVKEHPELVEREFILRIPHKQKKQGPRKSGEHRKPGDPISPRAQVVPRGSRRRAVAGGLLPKGVEQAILDQ